VLSQVIDHFESGESLHIAHTNATDLQGGVAVYLTAALDDYGACGHGNALVSWLPFRRPVIVTLDAWAPM